ncbi:MAG: arginine--tRNA ligase, partial [Micavibrio sp.]|nr:arginine--tRNA ligase [Micavibrio sp.]
MSSLASILSEMVGDAFAALDLPRELGAVRVSDRPDLCQFQCNGAMGAAKLARKNPREVAAAIVEALSGGAGLAKVEVAGPGFINIDVTEEFLAQTLGEISSTPKLGVEEINDAPSVVLDYGGPNIAKAMHVGHLRSSIIGDTLRRIYAFAGYRTIGDVHMGDWGTPMGMILSELEISGFSGEITMEYLANIYPKAAQACKDDAARMEAARAATKRLQNGDVAATSTWQKFIDVSIEGMKKNFDALGVHFDEWKGESDAHPYIAPMVEDLKARNIVVESEGALIVPVEREDDKKDVPPLILLKSDGAVLYGTTDLATIVERVESHNPLKIIYIVDQRQGLHFEQVFRAAEKSGIVKDDKPELIHAGFGTMNGTDGKPFKTRAGGVMRLEDLIEMGMDRARVRLAEANLDAEIGADEREDIAQKVAIAAIKFADLQNQRQSDYVFDLDRLTSFEGKSGPYLLYQAVRI